MTELVFSRLLEMSWAGSVAVVFVLALGLVLRKAPKVYTYALWGAVLLRLLCPWEIAAPVSLVPRLEAGVAGLRQEFQPQEIPVTEPPVRETNEPTASADTAPERWTSPVRNGRALAARLWGMGVLVMMGYAAYALWKLRRQLREAIPLEEGVYHCDQIPGPFVLGLVRPKIYLPSALSERERVYILAHERCHIRRLDHWTRALGYLALCLHWFNPLVWLAYIQSDRDMEMSCDEAVVKELGSEIRGDYAASLLRFAAGRHLTATPLAFGEGDPKGRIRNLGAWKRPVLWVSLVAGVLCAILAVCLITTRPWPYLRRSGHSSVGPGTPVTYDLHMGASMEGTLVAEFWDGGELVTSSAPMAFGGDTDELSLYLRLPQSGTRDQQAILTMVARDRHEKDPELVEASLETAFSYRRGSDTAFCAFSFREKRETFSTAPGKSHILAVYGLGDETGAVPSYFDNVALLEMRPDLMEAMGKAILVRVSFPFPEPPHEALTLDRVVELAQKGEKLTWSDFEAYAWEEVGAGLCIRVYETDTPFYVMVGGPNPREKPWYVRLCADSDNWIDLRTEDPEPFIQSWRAEAS